VRSGEKVRRAVGVGQGWGVASGRGCARLRSAAVACDDVLVDSRKREDERRPSASTAGLEAEERARIRAMTSIERMTRALELGQLVRELAKAGRARGTR
jgi:hypothetical protein